MSRLGMKSIPDSTPTYGGQQPQRGAILRAMLSDSELIAFAATTDLARARSFYGDTLGLRFVTEDDFAVSFDANGTRLRVSKVDQVAVAGYTVLGWVVDDIAASVRALAERGVEFQRFPWMTQDDLGIWTAPGGAKVAWFKDPDGNTLSLTQVA
jgi:catechol 2,3-dioxygenase-like lactoylglutathione lyase family enzyme